MGLASTLLELSEWTLLFLLFSKNFFSKVKKSFQLLIDFNHDALWRPFCPKLAPQPEFMEKELICLIATTWYPDCIFKLSIVSQNEDAGSELIRSGLKRFRLSKDVACLHGDKQPGQGMSQYYKGVKHFVLTHNALEPKI